MSFHGFPQVIDDSYISHPYNGLEELTNPEVGYKWHQSECSSDLPVMNLASPTSCYPGAYYFPQHQVSNPGLYYSHEYEPPPTVTSKSYASDIYAYQMFDTSSEREYVFANDNFDTTSTIASLYTLTCHTLSTGQPYYALELASSITAPCPNVASSIELSSVLNNHEFGEEFTNINEVVNSVSVLVKTDGSKECGDGRSMVVGGNDEDRRLRGNLLENNINLGEVIKDDNNEKNEVKSDVEEIENDIDDVFGDGSLTDLTRTVNCSEKLTNICDDLFVMDNFRIHQNSSSITDYVEDFMYVKNRAELIFKRKFDDDLLSYCFVEGLKEDLRDALELWAPRTLQEAIILAKYKELLLEESLMVVNVVMKCEKGPVTNYCVKNLSARLHKDEKPMVAEELPAMVNNKRQTPNDHMLQTIKKLTSTIYSVDLGINSGNIGEDNVLIFDPGGNSHNAHEARIINLFKEIIVKKGCEDDEGGEQRDNCSKIRSSLVEELNVMLKATKMCLAFEVAGITLFSVTRSDLLGGAISGDKFFGFMLAGNFGFKEVLSYAIECSAFILLYQALLEKLQTCVQHSNNTATEVFTRDQLGRLLNRIHGLRGGIVRFKVPISKKMASAWHWCEITLVFDPGNLFINGAILVKLVAATMDELEILFNNNISQAPGHTPWTWTAVFASGIIECDETVYTWVQQHNYLVSSIARRMASAWYWSIVILVFDPGDFNYSHPGDLSCC
uniref:Uncharacterized protein n=1 Tax=Daucus carota subsp. sativus TaxID=79200 RepID=A0A166CXI3_DAUCS